MFDHLVWKGLTGPHRHLALGNSLARRYLGEVAPFGALQDQSESATMSLASLLRPGDEICLIGQRLGKEAGLTLFSQYFAWQMLYDASRADHSADSEDVLQLNESDVPQMTALTDLVFPGYFRPATIRMGDYFGIFHAGRLVAMAGERLAADRFREISAVCTHPDHQRRGHAAKLVKLLIRRMRGRNEVPFLHVGEQNEAARKLYEAMGFSIADRAEINHYRRRGSPECGIADKRLESS